MWTNKDFTGLTFGQFPGGLNLLSSACTSLYGFYIFAAKTFCILCGSIYVSPTHRAPICLKNEVYYFPLLLGPGKHYLGLDITVPSSSTRAVFVW